MTTHKNKPYTQDDLRRDALRIFNSSLQHKRERDFERHYITLGVARELYHFFEDTKMILLCNEYYDLGIDAGFIFPEDAEKYAERGKQKAQFIIGAFCKGKKFIEERLSGLEEL